MIKILLPSVLAKRNLQGHSIRRSFRRSRYKEWRYKDTSTRFLSPHFFFSLISTQKGENATSLVGLFVEGCA